MFASDEVKIDIIRFPILTDEYLAKIPDFQLNHIKSLRIGISLSIAGQKLPLDPSEEVTLHTMLQFMRELSYRVNPKRVKGDTFEQLCGWSPPETIEDDSDEIEADAEWAAILFVPNFRSTTEVRIELGYNDDLIYWSVLSFPPYRFHKEAYMLPSRPETVRAAMRAFKQSLQDHLERQGAYCPPPSWWRDWFNYACD